MGGERLRVYWSIEMKGVLESYRQFEKLIPAESGNGSAHPAEDGRYVESILKETLKKFLPSELEVLNGFILRAGIESGFSGKKRKNDQDIHSSQLDLIIYDSANYPVYQRFGDTAVVLPEGVVGIISVKKTLRQQDISHEIEMLKRAGQLCAFHDRKGPFLALACMDDDIRKEPGESMEKVLQDIENAFHDKPVCYDEMPGFVGNFQKWTIYRTNKSESLCAEYQMYIHEKDEEYVGLQYLLKGIMNVYYKGNCGKGKQPGFVCFPSHENGRDGCKKIFYNSERSVRG